MAWSVNNAVADKHPILATDYYLFFHKTHSVFKPVKFTGVLRRRSQILAKHTIKTA